MTSKLLNKVIDTINSVKLFFKCYNRHSELIVKYNTCLKNLLQLGIPEPVFNDVLVYYFKRIVGKPYFSDQFIKIIKLYKKSGIQHGYHATVCMPGYEPNQG